MKAPVSEQRSLLELQAADTRLAQLNHKAKNLPQQKRLDELATQIGTVSHRMAPGNGELEDAQLEISRVESDVEVVATRMGPHRGRVAAGPPGPNHPGAEAGRR